MKQPLRISIVGMSARTEPLKILIIGKSARIHVIAHMLSLSASYPAKLFAFSEVKNPGLMATCERRVEVGNTEDRVHIKKYVLEIKPDFVIIGPEEPLAAGVVDLLIELGVPCVGPTQVTAQIESSKACVREILERIAPEYNPRHRIFDSIEGIEAYMAELGEFVIKPDGLTGGKGVRVFGDHIQSISEGLEYCSEIITSPSSRLIVEEKLDGEEFSLQSLCDGTHIAHTVPVQDHKRAYNNDKGPNTGGMGSYSCSDHLLPFLSKEDIDEAWTVNEKVFYELERQFGEPYRGILYGGFMLTSDGLKLIEYNCRFGDPEVMNVLSIMTNDFIDVCLAIINGHLDRLSLEFEKKSTVCKYLVPEGYPDNPKRNVEVDVQSIPAETDELKVFFGAVDKKADDCYVMTGSRAIAVVGIADDLSVAEAIAERAASQVKGPLHHRTDIGTSALVQRRVDHMNQIRKRAALRTLKQAV